MSESKFDTESVGKLRHGMGAMISIGMMLLITAYYDPSVALLSVGVGCGALLFVVRRVYLGTKRFERPRSSRMGLLTLSVVIALIVISALSEFLTTFNIPSAFVWMFPVLLSAFALEMIEGFLFYAKRS